MESCDLTSLPNEDITRCAKKGQLYLIAHGSIACTSYNCYLISNLWNLPKFILIPKFFLRLPSRLGES